MANGGTKEDSILYQFSLVDSTDRLERMGDEDIRKKPMKYI